MRHDLLSLTASAAEGPFRADPRGTPFERLLARYAAGTAGGGLNEASEKVDDSHPYMRFDRAACITCRLCLNACEQVQGQFVYGIEGRGADATDLRARRAVRRQRLRRVRAACVDVCPTGAMSDRDRARQNAPASKVTESVCGYCGVGCRVSVESR
jgi:predicted molibdopterin-dependent oxidoreductase YjgC